MQRFLGLLLLICCTTSTIVAAPHTKVRMFLSAETVRPGDTVIAAIQMRMEPGWHTYWRNPGESGGATEIDWQLPEGITAGAIQWPVPEKYDFEGVITYVHHDEAVLLIPLKVASTVAAGTKKLAAKVSWLECEELCLPGSGSVSASLNIGDKTVPSGDAAIIEAAASKIPPSAAGLEPKVMWEKEAAGDSRALIIEWKGAGANPDFFAYPTPGGDVLPAVEVFKGDAGKVRIRKTVKKLEGEWPKEISGLLIEDTSKGQDSPAYELTAPMSTADAGTSPAPFTAAVTPTPTASWPKMLLFAFLGGMILNIMPCVLPVIALKILGFVQQSKEEPQKVKRLGFVYVLGVVFSFLVLAGLVIAVQKAGKAAGWGMQFQDARFVIVMIILITLVALNLFGVFEVTLGGKAMDAAANASSRQDVTGAFFNGILATALATPCTAPFLAVALGFAFAQPPLAIVLMFVVMGIGLAAPYFLLSWNPQWLKFLPKPGAWMEKFKIAMGFPMLATAIWLISLTSAHFGSRGPLWVGLFLAILSLAAWIWGEFVQRGRKRKSLALALSLLLIVAGYGYALERELDWRSPTAAGQGQTRFADPDGIEWQPWSEKAVADARAQGRPVLVDFTADWCVTCQANKKTSLEIPSVREKLKEINAVPLLGDYTRGDDAITAELQRHQRAGVPLVLVYPRDSAKPPIVLPALLTPGIVLDALDKAAK